MLVLKKMGNFIIHAKIVLFICFIDPKSFHPKLCLCISGLWKSNAADMYIQIMILPGDSSLKRITLQCVARAMYATVMKCNLYLILFPKSCDITIRL